jgi:acyl phosphate:glycerol-3-phosphate acyltransferase
VAEQVLIAAALVAASFLCGSVPWALLVTRWARGVDIRTVGSGNVGATNAYRVLGPRLGSLVLFLDFAKGTLPALLTLAVTRGQSYADVTLVLVALAAMLGHTYSPWLGFKGGKGFATGAGAVLVLTPYSVLLILPVFVIVLLVWRMVSLGSVTAAVIYPLITAAFYLWPPTSLPWQGPVTVLFAFVAGGLVVWRHRSNIRRIIDGTESRATFGIFKPDTRNAAPASDSDTRATGEDA